MRNRKSVNIAVLINVAVLVLLVVVGAVGVARAQREAPGRPLLERVQAFGEYAPSIGGESPCPPPYDQECPPVLRRPIVRR